MRKKALWAAAISVLLFPSCRVVEPHTVARVIEVGGLRRTYHLHVPPNVVSPAPLVVVLHGGGGHGLQMESMSGFSALSDHEGFIAVYPDGIGKNWYDGREGDFSKAHAEKRDDAGFIAAMIDEIARDYAIDSRRIYATGISNGGFMSNYLALKLNARLAAVAPVVGGMAEGLDFRLETPVSVLYIQGTDDPLVPYGGGEVKFGRGRFIPTDAAILKWVEQTQARELVHDELPDVDPDDGCVVRRSRWIGPRAEVQFLKMEGGGHTWPGGPQYLPKGMIGPVCRDFGSATIWEFFKAHPKPE